MFRLDVSHLQTPTISLPDALSTLGSHSVYMRITYLLKLSRKVITTECVICRLCLSMKPLKHKIPSFFSALMFTGYSTVGCRCRITVSFGMFLLALFIMDSCVSFLVKVAFLQTQVPIFRRNHATQHCRLEPLSEYNGQHYQSVGPGGDSYELRPEGVRLVSGAQRPPCSRCSAPPSSVHPW